MLKRALLEVSALTFRHEPGRPQVEDVSFALHEGQTFGVLGANECGKTSLAQLLLGNLVAEAGSIKIFGEDLQQRRSRRWPSLVRALLGFCASLLGVLAALKPAMVSDLLAGGAWALPLFLVLLEAAHQAHSIWARHAASDPAAASESGRAPRHLLASGIAYMSSEHDGGQKLPADQTVEDVIAQDMPISQAARAERRREVRAALEAAGFQVMAESGTPVGNPEQYLVRALRDA